MNAWSAFRLSIAGTARFAGIVGIVRFYGVVGKSGIAWIS